MGPFARAASTACSICCGRSRITWCGIFTSWRSRGRSGCPVWPRREGGAVLGSGHAGRGGVVAGVRRLGRDNVRRKSLILACLAASAAAQRPVITDQAAGEKLQQTYLAVTRGWTEGVTFTRAERDAMERGKQWEQLMMTGLDDPLSRRILAAGEPSFAALDAYYPGKVLDRTLLGTYSDPTRTAG